MSSYILRRLLLIIPTLLGILLVNFTLVQFVPGGPVEQAIARAQGQGDVLEGITGAGSDSGVDDLSTGSDSQILVRADCRLSTSKNWRQSLVLTNHQFSVS